MLGRDRLDRAVSPQRLHGHPCLELRCESTPLRRHLVGPPHGQEYTLSSYPFFRDRLTSPGQRLYESVECLHLSVPPRQSPEIARMRAAGRSSPRQPGPIFFRTTGAGAGRPSRRDPKHDKCYNSDKGRNGATRHVCGLDTATIRWFAARRPEAWSSFMLFVQLSVKHLAPSCSQNPIPQLRPPASVNFLANYRSSLVRLHQTSPPTVIPTIVFFFYRERPKDTVPLDPVMTTALERSSSNGRFNAYVFAVVGEPPPFRMQSHFT